jgi:hypothetical protein
MNNPTIKKRFLQVCLLMLIVFSGACSSLSKNCRVVKHHYPQTWEAINELATRQAPTLMENQLKVREEQCKAFQLLSDKWDENTNNSREVIKMALLRWGWLPGDAFPNCPEIVDYQMVYMEYLQKNKTP